MLLSRLEKIADFASRVNLVSVSQAWPLPEWLDRQSLVPPPPPPQREKRVSAKTGQTHFQHGEAVFLPGATGYGVGPPAAESAGGPPSGFTGYIPPEPEPSAGGG